MTKFTIPIISAALLIIFAGVFSHAQTEGFNVKTPVQTISDNSSKFINDISADGKRDPGATMPIICRAECILVIPSIQAVSGRDDFAGTGLLGCRYADSGKLAPPIFFQITNLESFDENGGGLIILVMYRNGVKSILGDQLQLNPQNTASGSGKGNEITRSFIAYAKPAGGVIKTFDASGGTLVYDSGDTFNAYQQDIDPIDIMLFSIDIPPALRGFNTSIEQLRKGCK